MGVEVSQDARDVVGIDAVFVPVEGALRIADAEELEEHGEDDDVDEKHPEAVPGGDPLGLPPQRVNHARHHRSTTGRNRTPAPRIAYNSATHTGCARVAPAHRPAPDLNNNRESINGQQSHLD